MMKPQINTVQPSGNQEAHRRGRREIFAE